MGGDEAARYRFTMIPSRIQSHHRSTEVDLRARVRPRWNTKQAPQADRKSAVCHASPVRLGVGSSRVPYLVLFLDLQIIVDFAHAVHLLRQLFCACFLISRFDDTVQRNDLLGCVDIYSVRLAALSATSLAFTAVVIVESSTYCPAVSPVIAVQPVVDNNKAIAIAPKTGLILPIS